MNYFKDSFEELKKVTWPSKSQTVKLSIITLIFTVISTLVITGFDFGFNKAYKGLLSLKNGSTSTAPVTELPEIDLGSAIQATDADGNPVNIDITPVEVEDGEFEGESSETEEATE